MKTTHDIIRRLVLVAAVDVGVVLLLFPYGGHQPPSSNFLAGPLWLFVTSGLVDKAIGGMYAAVALGLMDIFLFAPSWRTAVFFALGLFVWIGTAVYLSVLYAV